MDMSCLKFVLCIPPIANLQTVSNVDKKLIEKNRHENNLFLFYWCAVLTLKWTMFCVGFEITDTKDLRKTELFTGFCIVYLFSLSVFLGWNLWTDVNLLRLVTQAQKYFILDLKKRKRTTTINKNRTYTPQLHPNALKWKI